MNTIRRRYLENKKERRNKNRWMRANVVVNGVLAVFTILLFKVASDQTDSARESATAASQAVEIAKQTFQAQNRQDSLRFVSFKMENRAYVIQTEAKLVKYEKGKPFSMDFIVKNSGKTPADTCIGNGGVRLMVTEEFSIVPKYRGFKWGSVGVLAPNETFRMTITDNSLIITDSIYSRIEEKKLFVFVYGYIGYYDVFGDKHMTTFCARFRGTNMEGFQNCNTYNTIK